MTGEVKKYVSATTTTVLSVAANITNNQVAGNVVAGSVVIVDNSSPNYPYADASLYLAGFSSAPTANNYLSFWAVPQDIDGTADATAGAGVNATPANPSAFQSTDGAVLCGVFRVANSTSAQRIPINDGRGFDMPYAKASFFLKNETGQTVTAGVGTEMVAKVTPFSWGPV